MLYGSGRYDGRFRVNYGKRGDVLSTRDLNRAVLARQLLLERVTLPIPRALERIAGVQNQYAPNAYIRLWSCLEGFTRDDLTKALERRSVVQATLMRSTVHVVSRRDYWAFVVAIREAQRAWWLRTVRPQKSDAEMRRIARDVRDALASGPRRQADLAKIVNRGWGISSPWIDLVRVPPQGTWDQRRAHLFALAESWVGPEPDDLRPDAALEHLVRRYLRGFGPATANDIANWTGVPVKQLRPVLDGLDLRQFRGESGNQRLLDLPRAPLPHPDTPAPVRFLPTWDAVLLVHARRSGILEEDYRKIVFRNNNPTSSPTFLVDGRVVGTWKHEDGRIQLEPFERVSRQARRELAEEGERLAELHR